MRTALCLLAFICVGIVGADPGEDDKLIVRPDAFKTLVNPMCSHCRDEAKRRSGELRDADRALCWIRGYSDGGAIPIRFFLNSYRVISDTYGVFVFDPDAGYARAFAPSLDFRFHGWRNGVMVMKHKDGTLYSCLSGLAFDGPNKGKSLKPVPTLVSDWGFWLKQYPQNVAYHMFDKYQPTELPTKENEDVIKSRQPVDSRLPANQLVLGVVEGKTARAYPLDSSGKTRLINDRIDGKDCVVLWFAPTGTASAFASIASTTVKVGNREEVRERSVHLSLDDKMEAAPFVDKETGSHWDIAGRAIDGKLKGSTLTWLDSTQVKWFAWATEHSETTIFGKK